MTEPFSLTTRTPAGKIRYAVEQLSGVHAQSSAGQTKLIAVRMILDRLADDLDAGTIPATPICGDVFQSGITDRAQGPCLKPPGHDPADPWHQDDTGCRWRPTGDAPLRTPATPEATPLPTQATPPDCRWPGCLPEAEQQQLADDIGADMRGEATEPGDDPQPGCGCVDRGVDVEPLPTSATQASACAWVLRAVVAAPTPEDAERWTGGIRDLVLAEFGDSMGLDISIGPVAADRGTVGES